MEGTVTAACPLWSEYGANDGYLQERIDLRVFLTIPESRTRVPPLGVGDPERRRLSGPWE
jgi:hypothetical protein